MRKNVVVVVCFVLFCCQKCSGVTPDRETLVPVAAAAYYLFFADQLLAVLHIDQYK